MMSRLWSAPVRLTEAGRLDQPADGGEWFREFQPPSASLGTRETYGRLRRAVRRAPPIGSSGTSAGLSAGGDTARDLTQEVFLRVTHVEARRPQTATDARGCSGSPGTSSWTTTGAARVTRSRLRWWTSRRDPPPGRQPAVNEALAALPALDRDVFLMREVAGLGYEEIAEACELTPDAVRSRIHRTRVQLRDQLAAPIATSRTMAATRSGKTPVRITNEQYTRSHFGVSRRRAVRSAGAGDGARRPRRPGAADDSITLRRIVQPTDALPPMRAPASSAAIRLASAAAAAMFVARAHRRVSRGRTARRTPAAEAPPPTRVVEAVPFIPAGGVR